MRENEVGALKVKDMVDGYLIVDKGISDGELKLSRKSGGAVPYLIFHEKLDLWQRLQKHCEGKSQDDFIFLTENGKRLYEGCLYKAWKKACKDAGVKHISLGQASRHNKATTIRDEYMRKATDEIQRQLGHSSKDTQKAYLINETETKPK